MLHCFHQEFTEHLIGWCTWLQVKELFEIFQFVTWMGSLGEWMLLLNGVIGKWSRWLEGCHWWMGVSSGGSREPVADLRGGAGDARPPGGQNFFIFMQFSAKIYKIIGWHPPWELAPPPRGNPESATGSAPAPPSDQIFLDFTQFLRKFNKIISRRPPPRG